VSCRRVYAGPLVQAISAADQFNRNPTFMGKEKEIMQVTEMTIQSANVNSTYLPEPFGVTPKQVKLTQLAIDLIKRIDGTGSKTISVTDVARVAQFLAGSGWQREHFRDAGVGCDNPEELGRHADRYYDAVSLLMSENPEHCKSSAYWHVTLEGEF